MKDTDKKEIPIDIPLNGKMRTYNDPLLLGNGDFRQLINMRYTSTNPKGIGGMTKITSSIPTYTKHRAGIHFLKANPDESHVLIQSYNAARNSCIIQEITTAIPNAGNFTGTTIYPIATVWTAATAYIVGNVIFPTTYNGCYYECIIAGTSHAVTEPTWTAIEYARFSDGTVTWICRKGDLKGTFSQAPDGCIAFANGHHVLVWGGNEYRCARFINYDPNNTFIYDYTERINNDATDALNTAIIYPAVGGIDAVTSLLLHLNNNLTDSSANAFTVTNVGACAFTALSHFGSKALTFSGTGGQCITVPDNASFDFSAGAWTVDAWVWATTIIGSERTIYFQGGINSGAFDYMRIYLTALGAVVLEIYALGLPALSISTANGIITTAAYQHVQVGENGNNFYVFVNGSLVVYAASSVRPSNYDSVVRFGAQANMAITYTPSVAFTVGQIVTDTATGATALIVADGAGVLTVSNVSGIFTATDAITDPLGGAATVVSNAVSTSCRNLFIGAIDEIRVSKVNRNNGSFAVMTTEYGTDSKSYAYVGSTLPGLTAIKWYVNKANTTAGTPTIYYNDSSGSWTTVGSVTDNTATAGVSLTKTGTMTFADTTTLNKPKLINNLFMYWFKVLWSALDNTTSVYRITLQSVMQNAVDLWDGTPRGIASCQKYVSSYEDNTTNVLKQDATTSLVSAGVWDYPPETYLQLASFAVTSYVYLGFTERLTGLYWLLPHGQVNTTVAAVMIEYWNGSAYTSVGTVDDQTVAGSASLGNSGFMVWNPVAETNEYQTHVSTNTEYWYYRISWSGILSGNTKVDFIAGISAPKTIDGYNSVAFWLNSIILLGDKSGKKNRILSSGTNSISIWNGRNQIDREIGINDDLVSGGTLFSRYGSDVTESMIVHKAKETWYVNGTNPDNINHFKISGQYGNVAPKSLAVCDLGYEIAPGINKAVMIWQAQLAIVMFDNGAVIDVSGNGNIENFFLDMNKTVTDRVHPAYANLSSSFFDPLFLEYHWCFADGSSTGDLNREFVYDITRRKWYEIDRTTGKRLQLGIVVSDMVGNKHNYGAIDIGYIERLEYGTSMDGAKIPHTMWLGDMPLYKTVMYETELSHIKILGKITVSTAPLAVTHYLNGDTTGTTVTSFLQAQAGKRIYQKKIGTLAELKGALHSLKLYTATDDVVCGLEPLAIGLVASVIKLDKG